MSELKKIITIGPIYPYKGGIAHYSGLLLRNLQKKYDAQIVSYKLMYPKILYPGGDQRDWKNDYLKNEKTHFLINTINPFTYIHAAKYIKAEKPDMVIVHWWHPFFAPAYFCILKNLGKEIKKCICCNNVMPHDRFPLATFLTKRIYKQADMFIIHSKKEQQEFEQLMGSDKNVFVGFCPDLSIIRPENDFVTKEEARIRFNLKDDEKVMLFFGFIRKYKGLHHLLNALAMCNNAEKIRLVIAGDFYESKEEYVKMIDELHIQDKVDIYDGYISDEDIPLFFAASDLVVLPYESATTSGVIQMAYHYNIPVIATDVGEFPDVVIEDKTGYIVKHNDASALAKAIEKYFEGARYEEMVHHVEIAKQKYSWDRMVDGIEELWNRSQELNNGKKN